MAVKLWESSSQNAVSTTINGSINDTVTTVTLTSTSNLVAPGVIVLDRQDGSGNNTPTKREYISFTAISSNDLTGVTRGVAGSTAQSHTSGALAEATISATHWTDMVDFLQVDHISNGTHDMAKFVYQADATGISGASGIRGVLTLTVGQGISLTGHGGASGYPAIGINAPITPVFTYRGAISGVTTSVTNHLIMPYAGEWKYATIVLGVAASGASLVVDVNKNFTSIFEAGTRLGILGSGTFASTASINTKPFVSGNVFSVDIDNPAGSDITVMLHGVRQ
mgnify:CR=1 FL=1